MQHDALKNIGCERIFDDQITGSKIQRPELEAILQFTPSGDVILLWRLDRLSRSLKDLIEMVALLDSKKIGLRSLYESIDTSSSSGKLIFHIFGALPEFERESNSRENACGFTSSSRQG
ncbi:recombinase family protein [Legionella longbeachae]|uniref:recombinase family protein n=1 Tax=Legionella longbeachae TaxID=450 RepID=UPI001F5FE6AB|nr:recombinase family protein [Legionella longbeachae]